MAITKIITTETKPRPISEKMNLRLIRPMNIRTRQVTNSIAAVEKFAGRIRMVTAITGKITGRNPFLKFSTSSCFLLSTLARYMIRNSFAISELWNVRFTMGTVSQRFASLRLVPETRVNKSRGRVSIRPICDILEK